MRILCNILVVLFVTATAVGQQINPVPDYIFRNSMSVGRNAPTDTSAYFSIGPRFGATRGFMPPMVIDTAAVTGTKRNGLLIYSIQRNSFLYWDSTGSRWSRIAANLDTLLLSTKAWRQKGDDSLAAIINTRTDTVNRLSTKAWRQKGIDSLASVRVGGSGTINRHPKFTASGTIGNGSIADSSSSVQVTILSNGNVGINETQPKTKLDVRGQVNAIGGTDNAGYIIQLDAATRFSRLNAGTNGLDLSHNYKVFANTQDNASNPSWSLQLNSGDDYFMLQRMPAGSSTMSTIIRSNNGGETLFGTTTDAGDYRVQVNGNQLVSGHIDVNTSGTTARISTRRPTSATGNNIWIGGGGTSASYTSGSHGSFNTSLGMFALEGSTTGFSNVAIGYESMRYATTGNGNVAVGGASLLFNGSGYSNVSIGGSSLFNNSSGYENSGIGSVVMNQNTTGYRNTAIGTGSIYRNTTGYMNVAIGYYAGDDNNTTDGNMTGFNNVFIGAETRPDTSNNNNSIVIGYKAIGRGSNTVVIGNSSITNNYFSGYISTGAPTGGTSKPWKLGEAATVSPTSPNRTIRVEIDGVVYYLHAKTTND